MLKTHTQLGKTLFMHVNMDILLLVILLLSVAVIYSGKLERDIARVCLILVLNYNSISEFQWNISEHLLFRYNEEKRHSCISHFPTCNQV